MIRAVKVRRHVAVLLVGTIAVVAAAPVFAEEDMFDGKWHFSLTPYLWLPTVHGTVNYTSPAGGSGSISTQVDPSSYLESLDAAAAFIGEVRNDRWLVFSDYMYLHLGGHEAAVKTVTGPAGDVQVPINTGGAFGLVWNMWTLAGGYTVLHQPAGFLDVFAGTRLLGVSTSLSWEFAGPTGALAKSGNASESMDKWDGIAGVKGEVRLGESKLFVPYYGDIGSGSNNWTWQAALGLGYHFGWGDAVLMVRNVTYKFNDNSADLRLDRPCAGCVVQILRIGPASHGPIELCGCCGVAECGQPDPQHSWVLEVRITTRIS